MLRILLLVALVGSVQPFKFILKPLPPGSEPQPAPPAGRPQPESDSGSKPESYYVAPIFWPPTSYDSPISAYRQSEVRYGYQQPELRTYQVPRAEAVPAQPYGHYQSPALAYLVVRPLQGAGYQQVVPATRYASGYDRTPLVRQASSTKGGDPPRWQLDTKGQEPARIQQETKGQEPPRSQQEPARVQQDIKEPPRLQQQEIKESPRGQQETKEPARIQPSKGQQQLVFRQERPELEQQQQLQEQEYDGQQPPLPGQPAQPGQPADQADLINQYYAIKQSKLSKLKQSLNKFAAVAKSKLTLGSSYQVVSEEILPPPPPQGQLNPDEQQQQQQQDDQQEQQEQEREIQQQLEIPAEQERLEPTKGLPPRIEQVQAQIKNFAAPSKLPQQAARQQQQQQHEIKDLHPSPTSDESFTPGGSDLRREHTRLQSAPVGSQSQAAPAVPLSQAALQPAQPVQSSPAQPLARPGSPSASASVATN